MARFISADYHFGEDRFAIMGRPFTEVEEMVTEIIRKHNNIVKPDDEVIVVGDVCYQKNIEYLSWIRHMNGKKTLVRGNHDRVLSDEQLKPYFDVIIPDGDGIEIDIEGIPCYIVHYPTRGRKDRFNLVGHIHTAFKYQLNMFNVGVDVNHFLPVNLKSIPRHLKSICEYYDQDVWCAYNEINASFAGKRGKPGNYFDNR